MCKDGFDCEGGTQIIDFASLRGSSADGESSSHTQAIAIVADGAIKWIGTYATEPENAAYLGPAAAGIFIGMALA